MSADGGREAGLEELLAECIDGQADEGPAAVERVLAAHPELAPRLRARLDSLRDLGLLAADGGGARPQAFGPYRVLRTLGVGGMGVVYLAEDPRDGRRVALKACRFAFGADDRARARFEREVRAASRLQHPAIVRVFDCGEAEGRPYYTMEHVAGATLADVVSELRKLALPLEELRPEHVARAVAHGLDEGALPAALPERWGRTYVECVCRLVLDVAEGLAHAHAHGVVHRDVNPSNVLVRPDGRALLFDLGLAQVADQPTLTRSGDFAGTPHYASPEQLAGRPHAIDARTDLYSLGATLYELLTLRRPFEGRSTPELALCIRTREPSPPRRSNPELARDLETICLKALEKDPRARYGSMRAFAEDLERFVASRPIAARPVGRARRALRAAGRRKARSTALALGALLAVGTPLFLWWSNLRVRAERDRTDAAARVAERRAADQVAVSEFLVEFFRVDGGESVSLRELLDRGVARLATGYADRPLVRTSLLEAIGRVHANLGLAREALPLFDRALALRKAELGPTHPDTARVLVELAAVHLAVGNRADAEALAARALEVLDAAPGGALAAARARRTLGRCLAARGEAAAAEAAFERALAVHTAGGEAESEAAAALQEDLARLARDRGQPERALSRYERALGLRRRLVGGDPAALARALDEAAAVARQLGRADDAARLDAEAEALAGRPRAGAPAPLVADAERALSPADFPAALLPAWQAEFDREFQEGITALQSGRHADAVARFARCAALDPRSPVAPYNACCGLALDGRPEEAERWLERAVARGLGWDDERFEGARRDPDLAALRARPAWGALVSRMESERAAARAYAAEPALRPPAGGAPRGVLVVLHDDGATKDAVVAGAWRALAEERGLALVAPSGAWPAGAAPEGGMRWCEDAAAFLRHPETTSAPLAASLRAYLAREGLDSLPLVLAGEGAAARVAFDLALRAPGLARGALLVDGPPHPRFDADLARRARAAGARVRLVDEADPSAAEGLAAWLAARGLDARSAAHARAALEELFGTP